MGVSQSTHGGRYSVEIEPSQDPLRSGLRRSATYPDALVDGLSDVQINSCWDLFELSCRRNPEGNCLGARQRSADGRLGSVEWLSYSRVKDMALRLGSGLLDLNLVPSSVFPDEEYKGARQMRQIGVFSKNRVEWFVLEQAANAFGLTLVPLYDTLGEDAMSFIMESTQMEIVACTKETVEPLLKASKSSKSLKTILSFDDLPASLIEMAATYNVTIHDYSKLINWATVREPEPGSRNDVSTLCYTSGTTGNPKGVILTQSNFIATICAAYRGPLATSVGIDLRSSDVHISYLPLAHVFERIICNVILVKGAAIGVFSGNAQHLLDDIKVIQPTIFISVPRLFNRINDKVVGGVKEKSPLLQRLFSWGISTKLDNLRSEASVTHALWDKVVFNKVRQLLGGKLRYMVVGGAPLDAVIQERMKILFCAPMCEGYGLTETLGASFITSPLDPLSGHVGGPLPSLEFCLESVEDMGYLVSSDPPRGELLLRGPSLSPGYFKSSADVSGSYDSKGWFHTGDVTILLPNGGLKIIDRRKNIFKLAQGEYVAPEKIENVYQQGSLISQVFAFGYSSKYNLVGIVAPDEETSMKWAAKKKLNLTFEALCANPEFKEAVSEDMNEAAKAGGLKGFEKLKSFTLVSEGFTVENGLLTPTFKLKRHMAKQQFEKEIESMYSSS